MAAGPAIRRCSIRAFPSCWRDMREWWPNGIRGSTDYTPVNEPLTTARFSVLYGALVSASPIGSRFRAGLAEPGARYRAGDEGDSRSQSRGAPDPDGGLRPLLRNMADAPPGRVREPPPLADLGSADRSRGPRTIRCGASSSRLALPKRSLDRFCAEPTPPSVVGLNYYLTSDRFLDHRLDRYPPSSTAATVLIRYADVEAVRARPRGIAGHRAHLRDGMVPLPDLPSP